MSENPSAAEVVPVLGGRLKVSPLSPRGIVQVWWGTAATLVVLGIFSLLSFSHFHRLAYANNWQVHTYRVLLEISELRLTNTNIENRLRGFAVIGDPEILDGIEDLQREGDEAFANLQKLTSDRKEQQDRLKRLARLRTTIDSNYVDKYVGNGALSKDVVAQIRRETPVRRRLWLELRDEMIRFEELEERLLKARTIKQEKIQEQAARSILGGSSLALVAALTLVGFLGKAARAYQGVATSLEESHELLSNSEALFRQLAEDSNDMICLHAANGCFAYASPAAQLLLGYAPRELVGRSPLDFWWPEDDGEVVPSVQDFLRDMEDRPFVRRFRHKNGSGVWLEMVAHALHKEGEGVSQWHTMSRDVSARVRDEARRQRLLDGLQDVVSATDELLLLTGQEAVLERAVAIAREKFGLDRCAIFLIEDEGQTTRGVFSCAVEGKTVRENGQTFSFPAGWREAAIHPAPGRRRQVTSDVTAFWGLEFGQNKDETAPVVPWMGATAISSSGGDFAVFYHDTLFTRAAHDEVQHETLAVFCQILGALLEREQMQTRLREHQQLLQTIIEHAPMMLYSVNREGVFNLAQGRALNRIGLGGDAILGKTPEVVLGAESPSTLAIRRALRGETVHSNVEYNGVWLDLWREPVRGENGEVEGAIGVGFDVSERVKAETELREALELQQAVVDGAAYAIIALDQNQVVRVFNRAAEQMTGYEEAEVLGLHGEEFFPHLHLPEELTDFAREVEAQSGRTFARPYDALVFHQMQVGVSEREWTYVRKDGSQLPVRLTGQLLRDETGKITGYVGIVYDLTESRRAQTVKNEFVSIVSHELRTPLTAIRGSLGLMQGGVAGQLPPTALQMIDIASKNADRLVFLINDILDIEKIESGKMRFEIEPLALRPLLENAVEQNRAYGATLGVSIMLEALPPSLSEAQIEGDGQRLMQVLANLLSNACKFTPEGTSVCLRARPLGLSAVRIEVQDAGQGVPDEFQSQLFERFSQADSSATRQKGGTGLGLAIARAIIEKHGGKIGYLPPSEEESRVGATFYFDLPLRLRYQNGAVTSPRLLICEDDDEVATLLETLLSQSGYETARAASLSQARELLSNGQFAAMTLDLLLPDGNGLELLHELRAEARTAALPVIVVSAHCEQGKLNGGAVNVLDWLQKPIDPATLLATIAQTRRGSQARVLHVEDDPDVRRIVHLILRDAAQIVPASSLAEAHEALKSHFFDLALLDLGLPDGNGLELVPLLNSQNPPVSVVVFSARGEEALEGETVAAQLTKSRTSNSQLRQTIERLLHAPAS